MNHHPPFFPASTCRQDLSPLPQFNSPAASMACTPDVCMDLDLSESDLMWDPENSPAPSEEDDWEPLPELRLPPPALPLCWQPPRTLLGEQEKRLLAWQLSRPPIDYLFVAIDVPKNLMPLAMSICSLPELPVAPPAQQPDAYSGMTRGFSVLGGMLIRKPSA